MARLSGRLAYYVLVIGTIAGIALLIMGLGSAHCHSFGCYSLAEEPGWQLSAAICSAFIVFGLVVYLRSE